ncbi:unnamed protein product [marine sediment metagenome]|uniref:Uncharacterized protein n=1 Tax=marine sediment metagenome TaxID=412755 RepID=X1PFC4_9ZZZZ
MSIFKHRFTIKKPKGKKKKKTKIKHVGPTGVDGAQAGKSVLDWEKGTIFRT